MTGNGRARRIRIVLADDHTLFRDGIKEILAWEPSLDVVGEAETGTEAVSLASRYRPDILLLDVEMPGPGAAPVIREIRHECPQTHIIVLTMHDEPEVVHQLLGCGAAAFLSKAVQRDQLTATIRSVHAGSGSVHLCVSRRTMERLGPQPSAPGRTLLTNREWEVLRLIAKAYTNAQVASRLHIEEATVKRHLTSIYAKLEAVSRIDAVRKATAANLLVAEDARD